MLNQYLWSLYLLSGGKAVVELFERNLSRGFEGFKEKYCKKIKEFHAIYCPCTDIIEDNYSLILNLATSDNSELIDMFPRGENQIKNIMDFLWDNLIDDADYSLNDNVAYFFSINAYISTVLTIIYPNLFIPYYYRLNFNVLENICEEFGIDLPEIPIKKDYINRFYYYGLVCEALNEFKTVNELTTYELCAFLYDFAPKYVGGSESYVVKDLPEPTSAYLIGSSLSDPYYSDSEDTITPWQCSPETKAGDMILMYLRTPVSAIDTIWRSVSVGFNDPFFYYYRCTYIARPQKMKQVSLQTVKN